MEAALPGLCSLGLLSGCPRVEVPDNLQGIDRLVCEAEALAVGLPHAQLDEVGGAGLAGGGLTDEDVHIDRQGSGLAVRPDIEAGVLVIGDEAAAYALLDGVLKPIEVTEPDISDHERFLF